MTAPQQYLYRIQPARPAMLAEGPTEAEARAVGEHFAYLQDLVRRGVVLLAGRTLTDDEESFGIVVFVAAGEPEARAIMTADPAVRAGVFRARLFPYRIALAGRIPPSNG